MLTGGKSLFLNLPDKLQEIYSEVSQRDILADRKASWTLKSIDEDHHSDL
ncbi:unnamed protein product, partial [Rotaria magnacalcarata]